jgi:alkylation response protein AidB-like acyl-CoA dehydrogenase
MDFDLNEEQRMLVDMLRTMGKREDFKKLAVEIDRTGEFPTHLLKKYAELGLLGMTLSPERGAGEVRLYDSHSGIRVEYRAGKGHRYFRDSRAEKRHHTRCVQR